MVRAMPANSSRQRYLKFFRDRRLKKPAEKDGEGKDKSSQRRYLRDYARWLWPYRFAIGGVLVVALITAAMDMVWPLAIKFVIDTLAGAGDAAGKLDRLHVLGLGVLSL